MSAIPQPLPATVPAAQAQEAVPAAQAAAAPAMQGYAVPLMSGQASPAGNYIVLVASNGRKIFRQLSRAQQARLDHACNTLQGSARELSIDPDLLIVTRDGVKHYCDDTDGDLLDFRKLCTEVTGQHFTKPFHAALRSSTSHAPNFPTDIDFSKRKLFDVAEVLSADKMGGKGVKLTVEEKVYLLKRHRAKEHLLKRLRKAFEFQATKLKGLIGQPNATTGIETRLKSLNEALKRLDDFHSLVLDFEALHPLAHANGDLGHKLDRARPYVQEESRFTQNLMRGLKLAPRKVDQTEKENEFAKALALAGELTRTPYEKGCETLKATPKSPQGEDLIIALMGLITDPQATGAQAQAFLNSPLFELAFGSLATEERALAVDTIRKCCDELRWAFADPQLDQATQNWGNAAAWQAMPAPALMSAFDTVLDSLLLQLLVPAAAAPAAPAAAAAAPAAAAPPPAP